MRGVSARTISWGTTLLTLLVWVHYSSYWWVHLEGDSPLYSLMSLRVLDGRHFLMTAGQSHGGTLLVYVRALLFKIFGVSHFLGFFVNGMAMAIGVGLWTRFGCRLSGNLGGLVTGILGAVATERVVRAACTDYFAITVVTSGLMLNYAEALTRKNAINKKDSFLIGALAGVSWYLCRFSALYLLGTVWFYLALLPTVRRRLYVPSRQELLRGKVSRFLSFATCVSTFLCIMAFFTSDRFLGVNAESNLKTTATLAGITLLYHRWRVALPSLGKLGLLGCGALFGLIPEFAFKWLIPHQADRVTGLVRWIDIQAMANEVPARLGLMFSFYHPTSLGLVAASAAGILVILGFFSDKRDRYIPALGLVGLTLGAWFCVHTYMHLASQYFFIVMFPLYLAAGFAVRRSRFRLPAVALAVVFLSAGLVDINRNISKINVYSDSGILSLLEHWKTKWNVHSGFGHLDSDYNIMWAAKGKIILPYMDEDERFKDWQQLVRNLNRILYVHQDQDRQGLWSHEGYRVLEQARLKHGFDVMVLEREIKIH